MKTKIVGVLPSSVNIENTINNKRINMNCCLFPDVKWMTTKIVEVLSSSLDNNDIWTATPSIGAKWPSTKKSDQLKSHRPRI
jgi:hypothetical protein